MERWHPQQMGEKPSSSGTVGTRWTVSGEGQDQSRETYEMTTQFSRLGSNAVKNPLHTNSAL
jgi:hypothetical protein